MEKRCSQVRPARKKRLLIRAMLLGVQAWPLGAMAMVLLQLTWSDPMLKTHGIAPYPYGASLRRGRRIYQEDDYRVACFAQNHTEVACVTCQHWRQPQPQLPENVGLVTQSGLLPERERE